MAKRSAPQATHPSPVSSHPRLAERAWARHTYGRPWAPEGWFDLVEAFVTGTGPRDPERTAAALLLVLDNCHDWDALVEGRWIHLVSPHVYVHFEGGGVGPLRALQLADRFVGWMGKRGSLHEWDVACLRYAIDEYRSCNGARRRGVAEAWEEWGGFRRELDVVVTDFLVEGRHGVSERQVQCLVHLVAAATHMRGTAVTRFGALDPYDLWEPLLDGEIPPGDPQDQEGCVRDIVRVAAIFYGWLRTTERLEASRAGRLERELLRLLTLPRLGPGGAPQC